VPKKKSTPLDDTPKTPSSTYLRMWRRADEDASGGEPRNSNANVRSRTLLFLHQEEKGPGGGDPNIIELLRKLQETGGGVGLRTVSGPTTEELAILELLEQRFVYQYVIDSILWPSLRKPRGAVLRIIQQHVDTAFKKQRSATGKKAAKVAADLRRKTTEFRNNYVRQEWRNLMARNVPERERAGMIAQIMAKEASLHREYPRSTPPIPIKALKVDTIRGIITDLKLRTDGI
jgi:hypothetical protein